MDIHGLYLDDKSSKGWLLESGNLCLRLSCYYKQCHIKNGDETDFTASQADTGKKGDSI